MRRPHQEREALEDAKSHVSGSPPRAAVCRDAGRSSCKWKPTGLLQARPKWLTPGAAGAGHRVPEEMAPGRREAKPGPTMPAHVLAPETQNRSRGRASTPTGPAPHTRGCHREGELPAGTPGGRRRKHSPQRRCGAEIPHLVKTTHATTGQDPQPRRTPALATPAGMRQHTRERHLTDANAMHGEDPQLSRTKGNVSARSGTPTKHLPHVPSVMGKSPLSRKLGNRPWRPSLESWPYQCYSGLCNRQEK